MNAPLFGRCLLVLIAGCWLSSIGCVPHVQYRTSLTSCTVEADPTNCQTATLEAPKSNRYLLGLVEFDDQGWLWNRDQMDVVLKRLQAEEEQQRLMIVVFVHGWKHNASFNDDNVAMFRRNLERLHLLEHLVSAREKRPPRKIAGVYVGWRGLSVNAWGLKELTFWERKNTAHEVGRGALTELLVRLEEMRDQSHRKHIGDPKPTRLVVIGHSFGGAATYSALAPLFVERAVEGTDLSNNVHLSRGFGDLVILINPAFEATRYGVLENLYQHTPPTTNQLVNLAIFTSKADWATKYAFTAGRTVSTLFDKYQSSFERTANTSAVGHFQPFITHDLVVNTPAAPAPKANEPEAPLSEDKIEQESGRVTRLKQQAQDLRAQEPASRRATFNFDEIDLRPRAGHEGFPIYVVAVDPAIIPDHNQIDTKLFRKFLCQFLLTFTPDESER